MIYPNQKYKPPGGRGHKNEVRRAIENILQCSGVHARRLLNKGITIEAAKEIRRQRDADMGLT